MYTFKSRYNATSREVTVYDSEGCWVGTLAVNPHGMVTHKMTSEKCRLIECNPFKLTDKLLKEFAIEAAYDSGIDEDVMFEAEAASTVVANWTIEDIAPLKVVKSDDPIFDAWMNR